jgi:hypothetical protein
LSKTGKRYGKKKSNHHLISGKYRQQKIFKKNWEEEEMTHECNKWDTLYPFPPTISFRRAGKNGMTQYSYT